LKLHTVFTLHKITGLAFGAVLFLLGFTGFFLDHDNFDVLWDVSVSDSFLPDSIVEKKQKAFNAYKIDANNPKHILAGSRMGLFVSFDGGNHFKKSLFQQVLAIEPDRKGYQENFQIIYAATVNGIYLSTDGGKKWKNIALKNQVVESFSLYDGYIYAVVDKRDVYKVDLKTLETRQLNLKDISAKVLPKQVRLSRLVRDLHYGRGLFNGDISLYINDFLAFLMVFLAISGFVIYFSIRKIRAKKTVNRRYFKLWIKMHSNSIILFSFIPMLFIFFITGVFLDHTDLFRNTLKQTIFDTRYLPPVYKSLSTDIWGFDYDGKTYRIGNRLGVFGSEDLQNWHLESKGFAYRIKRAGSQLLVSGMGSPNRVLSDKGWVLLKNTPHMPRDVYQLGGKTEFYNPKNARLPQLASTPLYYIMLGLHDGKLLYGQWVFINDAAVAAGIILLFTGFIKWRRKKQKIHNKLPKKG